MAVIILDHFQISPRDSKTKHMKIYGHNFFTKKREEKKAEISKRTEKEKADGRLHLSSTKQLYIFMKGLGLPNQGFHQITTDQDV